MNNVSEEELVSHVSMDATYHLSSRHHKINICLFWQFQGSEMDATKDMTELVRTNKDEKTGNKNEGLGRKWTLVTA